MCGRDNRYGHPHNETLRDLAAADIDIYRTDLHGTIVLTTDGQTYTIDVETEADPRAPPEEIMKGLSFKNEFQNTNASTEIPPSKHVIRDEEKWQDIWNKTDTCVPKREMPEIDFDKHMAMAVFMGRQRTGGYSIQIDAVIESEKLVKVHYSTQEPGPDDMVPQVITSPYHIVVPLVEDKEVKFIEKEEEDPADNDRININTASANQLQELHGIGPAISERIVDYRNEHGRFRRIEDIKNVSGIGPGRFDNIKDDITVEE